MSYHRFLFLPRNLIKKNLLHKPIMDVEAAILVIPHVVLNAMVCPGDELIAFVEGSIDGGESLG